MGKAQSRESVFQQAQRKVDHQPGLNQTLVAYHVPTFQRIQSLASSLRRRHDQSIFVVLQIVHVDRLDHLIQRTSYRIHCPPQLIADVQSPQDYLHMILREAKPILDVS